MKDPFCLKRKFYKGPCLPNRKLYVRLLMKDPCHRKRKFNVESSMKDTCHPKRQHTSWIFTKECTLPIGIKENCIDNKPLNDVFTKTPKSIITRSPRGT